MNNTHSVALQLEDFGWSRHFAQAAATLPQTNALNLRVIAVHRDALEAAGPGFAGRILPLAHAVGEEQATIGDWLAVCRCERGHFPSLRRCG